MYVAALQYEVYCMQLQMPGARSALIVEVRDFFYLNISKHVWQKTVSVDSLLVYYYSGEKATFKKPGVLEIMNSLFFFQMSALEM
jgi:hypothetical protein